MTLKLTSASLPQLASWVGFDPFFAEINRMTDEAWKKVPNWPPYNIRKLDDNHYSIEMAVAGFGKTDIDITTKENELVIKGNVTADETAMDTFIHKGIAERAFERSFTLADSIVVKNASLVNGMLRVWLEQIIPEEKKPRKVDISEADEADIKTIKPAKSLPKE
jgi:molecular chaperone IbpA